MSEDGIERIKYDLIRANNATDPMVDEKPKYALLSALRGLTDYYNETRSLNTGNERSEEGDHDV